MNESNSFDINGANFHTKLVGVTLKLSVCNSSHRPGFLV